MKNELIKLFRLKAEEGFNYGCIVESQFDDLADRIEELSETTEQLCLVCKKVPATHGIGETKTVCGKCWNKL